MRKKATKMGVVEIRRRCLAMADASPGSSEWTFVQLVKAARLPLHWVIAAALIPTTRMTRNRPGPRER